MNPSDYQKVKELFNSVLEIEPEGRAAFLDSKCDGENGIRAEVERLLASCDSEFLKVPAGVDLTNGDSNRSSRSGQQIGHYTILEKIGSGGMGDVYLAEDGKLGRMVAIKILPETFTEDADRLRRFEQEARTASALNHQNILTIFEIGETDDTHYIATEYIDGETLRSKLNRGKLSVDEALDIAVQCASALSAAHENGIIHRDIKPENIMLRRDNLVKVLDFGLAKLVEKKNVTVSHDALTEKHVKTAPGVIMGTVQYMSPEQTRGHATDARTDIWSLTVVIYEMVAGRAPFSGDSSADLIAEIVRTHPVPLSKIDADIPERLDEIVAKALEKDPDERYQIAKDLFNDLKRLKRKLDVESEIERSHTPATQSGNGSMDSTGDAKTTFIAQDTNDGAGNTVSSAEYIVSEMQKHKKATAFVAVGFLVLVAGAAMAAWYGGVFDQEKRSQPVDSYDISRVTNTGKSSYPALSPDGKFVAFVNSEVLEHSIVIRQVATGADVSVVKPQKAAAVWGLRFSNDGNYLYYSVTDTIMGRLFRVPILGGTPTKIVDNIDSEATFSPDGTRFAFARWRDEVTDLIIINADGSEPETFLSLQGEAAIRQVGWSPDGKRLALVTTEDYGSSSASSKLNIISLADKKIEQLGEKVWSFPASLRWRSDGRGLLLVARDKKESPFSIWSVSYPEGEARPITTDFADYYNMSQISSEGIIAIERGEVRTSIWSLDLRSKKSTQLTPERVDVAGGSGICHLRDGSLLATKWESGNVSLWKLSGEGFKTETRLTERTSEFRNPFVTADGRYILSTGKLNDGYAIWRMNADGSGQVPLTKPGKRSDVSPVLLGDNSSVLFIRTTDASETRLMKTTIEGGEEQELLFAPDVTNNYVSVSGDGTLISLVSTFVDSDSPGKSASSIRFFKWDGVQLLPIDRKVDTTQLGWAINKVVWADGGSLILNGSGDLANLYFQQAGSQRFTKITDFKDGIIRTLAPSNDGDEVFFVRLFISSDIFLMKDKASAKPAS